MRIPIVAMKLIGQIFDPNAFLVYGEGSVDLWLFCNEGQYLIDRRIFCEFQDILDELWSIKNSITLYKYAPVVAA